MHHEPDVDDLVRRLRTDPGFRRRAIHHADDVLEELGLSASAITAAAARIGSDAGLFALLVALDHRAAPGAPEPEGPTPP